MHTALVLETGKSTLPLHHEDHFFEAPDARAVLTEQLGLPTTLTLGVAGVHAEKISGEQPGLITAGAGPDLHDHVFGVARVLRKQQLPQLFLQRILLRFEARDLRVSQLAQLGILLVEHLARALQLLPHLLVVAVNIHRFSNFRAFLGVLGHFLVIAGHFRIRHKVCQLLKTFLKFRQSF